MNFSIFIDYIYLFLNFEVHILLLKTAKQLILEL